MTLDEIRAGLANVRGARVVAREKIERTYLQLSAAPAGEADALRQQLQAQRDEFDRTRAQEIGQFAAGIDPRRLVLQLDGAIPLLMVPLRVQTRFHDRNLLIRVYPDDLSIQDHEPRLSTSEQ